MAVTVQFGPGFVFHNNQGSSLLSFSPFLPFLSFPSLPAFIQHLLSKYYLPSLLAEELSKR